MLNYFLQHLVGPKMGALKVKDFSEFDFKPQQLVSDICTIYLNLGYVLKTLSFPSKIDNRIGNKNCKINIEKYVLTISSLNFVLLLMLYSLEKKYSSNCWVQTLFLVSQFKKVFAFVFGRDEENFCATVPKDGRSYSPTLFSQTVRVLKKINKPGDMIVGFGLLADKIKVLLSVRDNPGIHVKFLQIL